MAKAPTQLLMTRDAAGKNTFGIIPPTTIKGMLLVTNTEQHFTVPNESPSGKYLAVFSAPPGISFWVAYNGNTALIPSGAVGDVTSEHMPAAREVRAGSVISLISSNTFNFPMSVALYAKSE